jgi:hypothetical protein
MYKVQVVEALFCRAVLAAGCGSHFYNVGYTVGYEPAVSLGVISPMQANHQQ